MEAPNYTSLRLGNPSYLVAQYGSSPRPIPSFFLHLLSSPISFLLHYCYNFAPIWDGWGSSATQGVCKSCLKLPIPGSESAHLDGGSGATYVLCTLECVPFYLRDVVGISQPGFCTLLGVCGWNYPFQRLSLLLGRHEVSFTVLCTQLQVLSVPSDLDLVERA